MFYTKFNGGYEPQEIPGFPRYPRVNLTDFQYPGGIPVPRGLASPGPVSSEMNQFRVRQAEDVQGARRPAPDGSALAPSARSAARGGAGGGRRAGSREPVWRA